jgi:hypothetical protein
VARYLFPGRFLFCWSGDSGFRSEQELTSRICSQINRSPFCASAGQTRSLFQVVAALGFSVDLGLAVVLPCSGRYSAPGADLLFPPERSSGPVTSGSHCFSYASVDCYPVRSSLFFSCPHRSMRAIHPAPVLLQ